MRPPPSRVTPGSEATGNTSSDEPTHTIRSASAASAYASEIASSGSISPNRTTSGFSGAMQAVHSGAPGCAASSSSTRSSATRPPHSGETLDHPLEGAPPAALGTDAPLDRALHLDHVPRPRAAVQPVDVLRHDPAD